MKIHKVHLVATNENLTPQMFHRVICGPTIGYYGSTVSYMLGYCEVVRILTTNSDEETFPEIKLNSSKYPLGSDIVSSACFFMNANSSTSLSMIELANK